MWSFHASRATSWTKDSKPANDWFEWQRTGHGKQPAFWRSRTARLGVRRAVEALAQRGEFLKSFIIVTTAALRRVLRMRLGITPDRLQVICTSASLKDSDYAVKFGAQLTGKDPTDFRNVQGDHLRRLDEAKGTVQDATALDAIDLRDFYESKTEEDQLRQITKFLEYRGIDRPSQLPRALYDALVSFGPMANLINRTMAEAQPVDELSQALFDGVAQDVAARAVTNLVALGSLARRVPTEPSLLPCRVHSFYRGLAGLWVCMDSECAKLPAKQRGGPAGKLFSQPRDTCDCGARVLELYTCRNCGTAYGRAYTNEVDDPDFLWSEPGGAFRTLTGQFDELDPIDLLLEEPVFHDAVEPAEYDLVTGRLNPRQMGPRNRQVYLRANRSAPPEPQSAALGEFRPCAVCGESAAFGRSSVQDHQTKGDQPFQALIARQIQVQPPSKPEATRLAPLRGRKVLKGIFASCHQAPYLVVMPADAARLRAGIDYPTDLSDFDRIFPDEAACGRFLERLRWPGGFVCPACSHAGAPWRTARGPLCPNCRRRASVTAGTIFQGTRKPLKLWFIAAWEIVAHKYGANAVNVKRMLSSTIPEGIASFTYFTD